MSLQQKRNLVLIIGYLSLLFIISTSIISYSTALIHPSIQQLFEETQSTKDAQPVFKEIDYGHYPQVANIFLQEDAKTYIWNRCNDINDNVDPVECYKLVVATISINTSGKFTYAIYRKINGEVRYGMMMITNQDISKFLDNKALSTFSDTFGYKNLEVGMTLMRNSIYKYGVSKEALQDYFGFNGDYIEEIWNKYLTM